MSGTKRDSLKDALRALEVNKPLRLSRSGLGLRPPSHSNVAEPVVPPTEAPRPERSPKEVAQLQRPATEAGQFEPPRNEVTRSLAAVFSPPPGRANDHRSEAPRLEEPHAEAAPAEAPDYGHAQVEAAQERPTQFELPPSEPDARAGDASATPWAGFFKLSHRVFAEPALRQIPGDCFRLFLWFSSRAWRYPTSTGILRASVRFIETETGMSHANISRSLKLLKDSGLVKIVEKDFKRGNIWRVSETATGRGPDLPPPRKELPQSERPEKIDEAASERASGALISRAKLPRNECDLKKIKNSKNLSQELPEEIVRELERTGPVQKRASEAEQLRKLLAFYTPEKINAAVAFVNTRGALVTGERCHSPFRYLATAIDDVLKAVERCGTASPPHAFSQNEKQIEAASLEEDKLKAIALARFNSELSSETRTDFLEQFKQREYPHGFSPPDRVVFSLAARDWLSRQTPFSSPFLRAG